MDNKYWVKVHEYIHNRKVIDTMRKAIRWDICAVVKNTCKT